jgi:hypothetical protein
MGKDQRRPERGWGGVLHLRHDCSTRYNVEHPQLKKNAMTFEDREE